MSPSTLHDSGVVRSSQSMGEGKQPGLLSNPTKTLNSSGPPRKTSYLVSITLLSRIAQPHYLLRHLEGETEHGAEPASLAISQPSTKDISSLPSPTLQLSPGDEIDSTIGCAWREELQGEPLVSRVLPPTHLLSQPLMTVSIEDRGGAA